MPSARAIELSGFWTDWAIMNLDKGIHGVGLEDGYLSTEELSFHLKDLGKLRKTRVDTGKPTDFVDMKIADGRKLYKDMADNSVTQLKYLPETILGLVSGVRQRACELLRLDDPNASGELDQYSIDHARARYNEMHPTTAGALATKTRALSEIDQLAQSLGLD
jgi:hypothetical protein